MQGSRQTLRDPSCLANRTVEAHGVDDVKTFYASRERGRSKRFPTRPLFASAYPTAPTFQTAPPPNRWRKRKIGLPLAGGAAPFFRNL